MNKTRQDRPGGSLLPVASEASKYPFALEVGGLEKSFDSNRVLRSVDLRIAVGEVHALVGLNGSGKSTIIKILSGFHTADAGTIAIAGRVLPHVTHAAVHAAGARFVHQDLGLAVGMNSIDNFAMGSSYPRSKARTISWRSARRSLKDLLGSLGYNFDVTVPVESLTPVQRTGLAIARALGTEPESVKLIVLDEPTATMPQAEVRNLFATIHRLKQKGVGVLYVTHHMKEVFDIADRVTVLRNGAVVAGTCTDGLSYDDLVEYMLGRKLVHQKFNTRQPTDATNHVTVRGLTTARLLGLDLTCQVGEILGIAGITGSGREDVAAALAGDLPSTSTLTIAGRTVKAGSIRSSIRAGLGYVPADRHGNAILVDFDVKSNLTLADIGTVSARGLILRRREHREAVRWTTELTVTPGRPEAMIATLSGGNQQKIILARWLRTAQTVIVLDEPTQGIDVESRRIVYEHLRKASESRAVIVCSSDTDELAHLCDRVVVLARGREVGEVRAPMTSDEIDELTLQGGTEV